jgi:hypothetical protein
VTLAARTLLSTLLALLLLPGCPLDERDSFPRGSADDDDASDDDDAGPDDDDAGSDDDDSQELDPNCQLTIDGAVDAEDDGTFTALYLASVRSTEVSDTGMLLDGADPIEGLELDNPEFPVQYRLCGGQDGTTVVGFLYMAGEDLCLPGNLFGSLAIAETTEEGVLDQNFTLDHALSEEDCEREGKPPE